MGCVSVPSTSGRGLKLGWIVASPAITTGFSTLNIGSWIEARKPAFTSSSAHPSFSTLNIGSWIEAWGSDSHFAPLSRCFSTLNIGSWIEAGYALAFLCAVRGFSTLNIGSWIEATHTQVRQCRRKRVSVPSTSGRGLKQKRPLTDILADLGSFSTLNIGSWIEAHSLRQSRPRASSGFSTLNIGSWIEARQLISWRRGCWPRFQYPQHRVVD